MRVLIWSTNRIVTFLFVILAKYKITQPLNSPVMAYRSILLFVLFLALSGCATIVSKSSYPIAIKTVPADANFTIVDSRGRSVHNGKTPTVINLEAGESFFRRGRYTILFEREGYEGDVFPVHARLDGWYFGNIIFGGLVGMLIIDPATGAMYTIDTKLVSVALQEQQQATTSIDIRALQQLPAYMHPFLQEIQPGK